MDNGLVPTNDFGEVAEIAVVLILVVMEDGLVHVKNEPEKLKDAGLNPCCDGRWSRTFKFLNYGFKES